MKRTLKLNSSWHSKHAMPRNATLEQRAKWHLAHAKHCGCRQIPATVNSYLARQRRPARRTMS